MKQERISVAIEQLPKITHTVIEFSLRFSALTTESKSFALTSVTSALSPIAKKQITCPKKFMQALTRAGRRGKVNSAA